MAQTTPPSLTPTPTPAPQRGDRTTFSARVDAFITWLTTGVTEFGLLATNVYNNAVDAYNSAVAAAASAATVSTAATTATAAANSATQSALVATNAANSPTYTGTSTSSLTLSAGAKTVTTQSGKNWSAGMSLRVYNSIGNEMTGIVTGYTGTTLTIDISSVKGSGTYTSWVIGYVSEDVVGAAAVWTIFFN